jgi:hypothetical protein
VEEGCAHPNFQPTAAPAPQEEGRAHGKGLPRQPALGFISTPAHATIDITMKAQPKTGINSTHPIDPSWLAIWCIIYLTFLILDLFMPNFWGATLIKYVGIFLCLVYAYQKFPSDYLLHLALLFTFLADTILVWTNWEIPGVYCFCFAQFFHIARFTRTYPKFLTLYFVAIFLIFIFAILQGVAPIYAISTIYALSLIGNIILSFSWFRQDKTNFHAKCAFFGFLLFLACDVSVGTQHLMLDGVFSATFLPVVSYVVWFFYYPSQVLISSSSNLTKSSVAKKTAVE